MRGEVEQALRALQQNHRDLDRALAQLQDTVFAFSMKVCGHREDAQDTAQETLLQAVPYVQKFDSPKALGVWLYKVARSRCLMNRRKSKFAPKQELSLEELMPAPGELAARGDDPERSALRAADAARVRRAVQKLPPEYRLVLVLHDMEELSTEEVSKITGLKAGTVRVRLHRARLFVRNQLAGKAKRRAKVERPSRCKRLFAALSDYLDEELDAPRCKAIEQHMSGCSPCQAFLKSLEETVQQLRRADGGRIDRREAEKVRVALREEYDRLFVRR